MAAPETRVMVKVPSYGEVLEEVKVEVLRLVGELWKPSAKGTAGVDCPGAGVVATSAVEREFREINRRTEVGARWSGEGVEMVARLLEEVRLNGTKLKF